MKIYWSGRLDKEDRLLVRRLVAEIQKALGNLDRGG
jgi:hypothetical protein